MSSEREATLGSGEVGGEGVVASVDLRGHDAGLLAGLVLFGEVLRARERGTEGGQHAGFEEWRARREERERDERYP